MNQRQIQAWIRAGCIAALIVLVVTLLFGADKIGRVNLVPYLLHKVEHFFYYGTMAFLLAYVLGRRWWWIALLAVPLIGALDEWRQLYIPSRHASVFDWLIDMLGTVVAVYLYFRWTRRREGKEKRAERREKDRDGGNNVTRKSE